MHILMKSAKQLKQYARDICANLEGHHHPFDEKKPPLTALFEPDVDPTQDPVYVIHEIAAASFNNLLRLYLRVLGDLAKTAKEATQGVKVAKSEVF